ncbi:expansin-A9-like [Rhodamnia argentea]|uniref:Expansin n=1 Tax=Rhodamnia argentea TaxID=178133 RepID=A0A8B8QVK4_9MYRT|nr:expansin-A9-like [Rhodamnia argentea]
MAPWSEYHHRSSTMLGCLALTRVLLLLIAGDGGGGLQGWDSGAHATFYGDIHGNDTMMGACGYGNLFEQGYGLKTTALSTVLFRNGATCGACYAIMCIHSPWCLPDRPVIRVTATNFCPPNYTRATEVWCNPPQKHFDLSMPMFLKIAHYRAGIVPVAFRRVRCDPKRGGIRFEMKGNEWWLMVLVYNVGGDGQVVDVKIKGTRTGWVGMSRNWGQNWQTWVVLRGQALSFRVTTSDGKVIQSDNVAPPDWMPGRTYEGRNFPDSYFYSKFGILPSK